MTREEAIWWVNHLFEIRKEEYFNKGMMKDAKEVEEAQHMAIEALSADAVSREEYEETDGVVTIEKQNANEVGEIKHIVICSPNYTRYFYNESMPLPPEAVQGCDGCRCNTRIPQEQCLRCSRYWRDSYERKGGEDE